MTKKKKEKIIIENLEISDLASEGKAVGKEDGMTIFVPYAVPGDIVQVEIYKKKKIQFKCLISLVFLIS